MAKQRPVHEVRLANVKAAIFENQTQNNGIRYGISLQRLYKDEQGKWDSTATFGRDELPIVEKVCHQVYLWIHEQQEERKALQEQDAA